MNHHQFTQVKCPPHPGPFGACESPFFVLKLKKQSSSTVGQGVPHHGMDPFVTWERLKMMTNGLGYLNEFVWGSQNRVGGKKKLIIETLNL